MSQKLNESWETINCWLQSNAPNIRKALNAPASKDNLDELEELVGESLPEDFRSLYSMYNGISSNAMANLIYGLQFFPIERVISEVENNSLLSSEQLAYADEGIDASYIFSKYRIPFGSDSSACLLCVDIKPTKGGTIGQVILLDFDCNVALNIAPSLSELYLTFANDLKEGKYTLSEDALEDSVEWLEPDQELDIINWRRTARWGDINI